MSDQQVIDYIRKQAAVGKTEQEIGRELIAQGVTPDQIERLRNQYPTDKETSDKKKNTGESRIRTPRSEQNDPHSTESMLGSVYNTFSDTLTISQPGSSIKIFGHDLFNNRDLTFEPNENIATPSDYRLGPGDEVIIDIWGTSEDQYRETISPEGSIIISEIGPIYLNGLTVQEANTRLKNIFASKYAGVDDEETDVSLTLGQIRSILVNIMGEANTPGSYRLSPFSTVLNALYRAGGVTDIGSLRNISVLRNGKKLYNVDIYDYLFDGKQNGNIRLQEGDVIIVPPYEGLINVEGNVKRPMFYEIKNGEPVKNIMKYTGGFDGGAFTGQITVSRSNGTENEIFNVAADDFNNFRLQDGDIISVGQINDRFANRIQIRGSVMQPGMYSVDNANTLLSLIKLASGLTEDAFLDRILLYRRNDDQTLSMMGVDLKSIIEGDKPDIILQKNDVIVIPSTLELIKQGDLTINGLVTNPGNYPYAEGTTIEDLIVMAGGLLQGASTARVDVSRRIVDPTSMKATNQTAKVYSFALKEGLVLTDDPTFTLEPYDIVEVRRSPGYQEQKLVRVEGEVLFEGQYALQNRNERVTDVIKRAGGIVDGAYVRGARLIRRMTDEEKMSRDESIRLIKTQMDDSVDINQLIISDFYSVGIELDKALENPGSYYDLVMKDGDRLIIPEDVSTVKISGEVMFPNTVGFVPGKDWKYYLNQAGGYGERAKKSKTFIVYMNGTVTKAKRGVKIEPGCQIVVPTKPAGTGTNWAQIIGYISSFATLGLTAASVYSIFRK
ncbi:MAG: SLBB domain-containing protein [Paramuribaculum sp.]|nr:SLBB domain-containing protein [Paramuribaculum sp.]